MTVDVAAERVVAQEPGENQPQTQQPERRRRGERFRAAKQAMEARLAGAINHVRGLRDKHPNAGVENDVAAAENIIAEHASVAAEAAAYLESLEPQREANVNNLVNNGPRRIDDIRDLNDFIDQSLPQGADPLSRIESQNRTTRFFTREDANGNPGRWQDGIELIAYNKDNNNHTVNYNDQSFTVASVIENYNEERDPQRGPMRRDSLVICDDGTVLVRRADRTHGKWQTTVVKASEDDIARALDNVNEVAMQEYDRTEQRRLANEKRRQPEQRTAEDNPPPPPPPGQNEPVPYATGIMAPANGLPPTNFDTMAPPPNTADAGDGERQPRRRRNWRTTLAAGATAAVTAAAALGGGGIGARPTEAGHPPAAVQTTEQGAQPPETTITETVEVPQVTPFTEGIKVLEKYAKDFSADPEAGQLVHPADVGKIVSIYNELEAAGISIDSISFKGSASDEDNSPTNAGLTEQSKLNEDLAQKRETMLEQWVNQKFDALGIPAPDLQLLKGQEDVLQPKRAEIAKYMRIAREGGFASIADMIDTYNANPQDCPPRVRTAMESILNDQRDVEVTFKGEQITETPLTITFKIPKIFLTPSHHLNIKLLPGNIGVLPDGPALQFQKGRGEPPPGRIGNPVDRKKKDHPIVQPNWPVNGRDNRGYGVQRSRGGNNMRQTNSGRR